MISCNKINGRIDSWSKRFLEDLDSNRREEQIVLKLRFRFSQCASPAAK